MAGENYINMRIDPGVNPLLDSRTNVISSVSFLSDSTFCNSTVFESFDDTEHDQNELGCTHLSENVTCTPGDVQYDNDVISNMKITSVMTKSKTKGKHQYIKSRSQHSVLYSNEDDLRMERKSIAPPIPRRKGRGRKMIRRMSTMPSTVLHEVQGWPRLKTVTVSLVSLLVGAGICVASYLAYKYIDTKSQNRNEGNHCDVLEELKNCNGIVKPNDDINHFEKLSFTCSKIHKRLINNQMYIIYGENVTFSDAMTFCHRIAKLNTVYHVENDCKSFKNHSLIWDIADAYWIGNWYQVENPHNLSGTWHRVYPSNDNRALGSEDYCFYYSRAEAGNDKCNRQRTKCCDGKKYNPICKC